MDFPNPYQYDPTGTRPIPGVVQQQMTAFIKIWLRMVGITMYSHKEEGLAQFLGAVIRGYPKIGEFWVGEKK